MFSTKERLQKRTPEGGINREEYIEHLVEEFHTTTNVEAQEQVSANLANFAYDPINYPFLKKSGAHELFIQSLNLPNQKLVLHSIAGLCNICLDDDVKNIILQPKSLELISNLLHNDNINISLNAITTLYLLITPETKSLICIPNIIAKISKLRESQNLRIKKLATIFFEDYCTKTEILNKN